MAINTYCARRVTRPKLANPLVQHHGAQVLSINGEAAIHDRQEKDGTITRIWYPVIDYSKSHGLRILSIDEFAHKREVTYYDKVDQDSTQFEDRLQKVLNDPRAYGIGTRDCENTADVLLEGEPANRQLQGVAAGVLLGGVAALAIAVITE